MTFKKVKVKINAYSKLINGCVKDASTKYLLSLQVKNIQEKSKSKIFGRQKIWKNTSEVINFQLKIFCHSPTQPQLESVLDLIMGRKPPTHPTPPPGTFKALPDNLGSWFSVCNLILTKLDEICKKKYYFQWDAEQMS